MAEECYFLRGGKANSTECKANELLGKEKKALRCSAYKIEDYKDVEDLDYEGLKTRAFARDDFVMNHCPLFTTDKLEGKAIEEALKGLTSKLKQD